MDAFSIVQQLQVVRAIEVEVLKTSFGKVPRVELQVLPKIVAGWNRKKKAIDDYLYAEQGGGGNKTARVLRLSGRTFGTSCCLRQTCIGSSKFTMYQITSKKIKPITQLHLERF